MRRARTRAVVIGGLLVSVVSVASAALPLGNVFGAILDGSWGDSRPVTGVDSKIFRDRLVGRTDDEVDFLGRVDAMRYSWRSHRRRAAALLSTEATRRAGLALLAENATNSERLLELVELAGDVDIEIEVETFERALAFDKDATLGSLTCVYIYDSLSELGRDDLITQCAQQTTSREMQAIVKDAPLSATSKQALVNLADAALKRCRRAIAPPFDYSDCHTPEFTQLIEPHLAELDRDPARIGTILRFLIEGLIDGKGLTGDLWAGATWSEAKQEWREQAARYRSFASAASAACLSIGTRFGADEAECSQAEVDDWAGIPAYADLTSAADSDMLIERALEIARRSAATDDPDRVARHHGRVEIAKRALLALAREVALREGDITPSRVSAAFEAVPGLQSAYLEVKSIEAALVAHMVGADLVDAIEGQAKAAAAGGNVKEAEAAIARAVSVALRSVDVRRAIELHETLAGIYGEFGLVAKQIETLEAARTLAADLKLHRRAGMLEIDQAAALFRSGDRAQGTRRLNAIAERWRSDTDGHVESLARLNLLSLHRGPKTNDEFQAELKRAKRAAERASMREIHAGIAFLEAEQAYFAGLGETERLRLADISADHTSQSFSRAIRVRGQILRIAELLYSGRDAAACDATRAYVRDEHVPDAIPAEDVLPIDKYLPRLKSPQGGIRTKQALSAIFQGGCALTG